MHKFLDLPSELKLDILSYLCDGSQANTYALDSLSKTCKLLKDIAQPLLYKKVRLISGTLDPNEEVDEALVWRMWHFARSIISRPDLARAVQSLSLPAEGEAPRIDLSANREDCELLHTEMHKPLDWCLRHSLGQSMILLATSLCNLKELHLCLLKGPPDDFLKWFSQESADYTENGCPVFSSLENFYIECDMHVNLGAFRPLLTLPSLRKGVFHSTIASYQGYLGTPLRLPRNTVHISELVLESCFMKEHCFTEFLKAIRHLKTFRFSGAGRTELLFYGYNVFTTPPISPMQLISSLKVHSATLQSLSLDFSRCEEFVGDEEEGFYPSLSDFVKLTSLWIEGYRLQRLDDLSPALQVIGLTYGESLTFTTESVRKIMALKDHLCPFLKEVALFGQHGETMEMLEQLKQLEGSRTELHDEDHETIHFPNLGFELLYTNSKPTPLNEYSYGSFGR